MLKHRKPDRFDYILRIGKANCIAQERYQYLIALSHFLNISLRKLVDNRGMKTNYPKISVPKLDIEKYTQLTASLLQRPHSPQWIEKNRPALQKAIQQHIIADMSKTLLITRPKVLEDHSQRPVLFKLLNKIAQNTAYALVAIAKIPLSNKKTHDADHTAKDEANKKSFMNKIFFANKKWVAAYIAIIQANQIKAYQKKLQKILHRLAKKEEQAAAMAAAAMNNVNNKPAEKPAPAPKIQRHPLIEALLLSPRQARALHLKLCLAMLRLKPGTKHDQIKETYSEKVKEWEKINKPTPQQQAEHENITAAHDILIGNEETRLENLPKEIEKELAEEPLTPKEAKDFAQTLRLDPTKEYRLVDIEEKLTTYSIANADSNDMDTLIKIQTLENTFDKLSGVADYNQNDPRVTLLKAASSSSEEFSSTLTHTPRLVTGGR